MATPLMEQYQQIKQQNPGVILFFRLGDFYEMFDEEAKRVSALLGLTLTSRNGQPMCGVPYHSASQYIAKLLKQGLKVAICEQTTTIPDPKTKLCPRKIVRIITPGTILEETMLEANNSSYLVSILLNKDNWAIACLEASTGDFWITEKQQDPDFILLAQALGNINPSEIICLKQDYEKIKTKIILPESLSVSFVSLNQSYQIPPSWPSALEKYPLALKSAQHCLDYIVKTNTNFKEYFTPYYKELSEYMQLDSTALETLELTSSTLGGRKNTLWGILDFTKTPMGSRLLKEWITRPLLNKEEICERQNIVSAFLQNGEAQEDLNLILAEVSDIKRILARIASGAATPRDLAGLRKSLLLINPIENWLSKHKEILPDLYTLFSQNKNKLEEISNFLFRALNEEQPLKLGDGGIIKQGFNKELDELNELKNNASSALEKICQTEREKTNIPNLKVGYNSVFGYYIEISKSHIAKVPYNYVRKQTLTNAERFITEELKELEKKILSAQDRSLRIELALFEEIKKYIYDNLNLLKDFASLIAKSDTLSALATAARNYNFVRPEICESDKALVIEKGRHPIVENNIPPGSFVANNLFIGGEGPQIIIITGPNMGGKSVFLKQTAILTIMAQIGSFVPARKAQIPITDKILTRIGAQDALSKGQSTFMVEMQETANILAQATPSTLVLLDEVGRGTSTYDGISIAWAITEYLYKTQGLGPKVLFATHYFELTELAQKYPKIANFHVDASEYKDASGQTKLNFLFEVKEGAADKSYGVHVAQLAGLPKSCILRAQKILKDLGEKEQTGIIKKEAAPVDLFSSPILEELKLLDTNKITPLEAIQILTEWKKRVQ